MPLAVGDRLGPHEILSAIGAGGMGEVYKARDTRLNRIVALKVLPGHLQEDADRRQRFLREAQAVAALEHPHICVLHDIGHENGVDFLVMEFLEGETLAARLEKGGLLLDQALRYGIEMAGALDNAHKHGIVHRDLKPANIMLTKSGVKLLDFGLAKLRATNVAVAGVTLPTQAAPLTSVGSILGTLHYMAPEQLEGKDADARSDVFALGAVLYEMLAGQRAFAGGSQASLIASILDREPTPIATLRPLTPLLVDDIVRRCLAKNADDRWQSAADLAFALRSIGRESAVATVEPAPRPAHPRQVGSAWAVAAAALVVAAASLGLAAVAWTRSSTGPTTAAPMLRLLLSEQLPAQVQDPVRSFAISRDGTRVAFVAEAAGVRRLWLRDMRSLESRVIPGTDNASTPFFSPEGERVGFIADGKLKTIALSGGAPVVLADALNARGAAWAADDTIIYSPATDAGLWQVAAGGGSPREIAQPDSTKGERSYRWPVMLPDGDHIVFTLVMSDIVSFDDARLVMRSLRTGQQREILRGGSFAAFSASGDLLYARAGALLAVPFDVKREVVTGTPRSVLDGVVTYPITGAAQYSLSENGTLLYIAGKAENPERALSWVTRDGRATRLDVPAVPYQDVGISPDGTRAALDIDGANASTWILDLDRVTMTRLTLQWSNNGAFWTGDGSRVAFTSARHGVRTLYWQRVDGQGTAEPIFAGAPPYAAASRATFSPDAKVVVFQALSPSTGQDLWVARLDGDRTPRPLLQTSFNEAIPALSPDGRWLAYVSNETGQPEVYVQPFPGPGRKSRVSIQGGTRPTWSRDGRELFYRNSDAMMGVKVQAEPSFSMGQPQLLFRKNDALLGPPSAYDVSRDGRFLMIENLPASPARPIAVVLNWSSAKR
jgi:serine/threonine-protein kinase